MCGICLFCVLDVFTKYAWVKLFKEKKGKTVPNGFIEIVNGSNRKPNKLCVDQGKEFHNSLMQKRLDNNEIFLMHSTHNEGKSVIAERFIKTLTLTRVVFLKLVVFSVCWGRGGAICLPPFIFKEELI